MLGKVPNPSDPYLKLVSWSGIILFRASGRSEKEGLTSGACVSTYYPLGGREWKKGVPLKCQPCYI